MKVEMFPNESKLWIRKLRESKLCNMKEQMRTALTSVCISVFAVVWWCVFYPELCFPQDTYEAVYESGEEADGADEEFCGGILQADGEQIIVKSRLLEALKRYKK